MKLIAYEPFPDEAFCKEYGVTLMPLEKLLAESDFVTVHVPLTPESKHLINKKTLALMKPTAFLINTARGGLVNEADLVEALKAKKIAGAAIDVFENEPPGHSPLFALDNVPGHAARRRRRPPVARRHGLLRRPLDLHAAEGRMARQGRGGEPGSETRVPTVRPMKTKPPAFRKILVATDFSEHAGAALGRAITLAERTGGYRHRPPCH